MAKQASMRGTWNAGKELVRSASKRFSMSSKDKTVLKPALFCKFDSIMSTSIHEEPKVSLRRKKSRAKKVPKIKDCDIPTKDKVFRSPPTANDKKKRKDKKEDNNNNKTKAKKSAPKLTRRAPHRVPSVLLAMWQRQRRADATMVRQLGVWEVQVSQMMEPPAMQPWNSFRIAKGQAIAKEDK